MENKKGIQLNQAFGAVLTLVLVAVLVIIAIFLFVTLSTSFEGTETTSVVNETATVITGSVTAPLAGADTCGFTSVDVTQVLNGTTEGELTVTTDYTVEDTTGVITNVTITDATLLVTYSYVWGSEACDASDEMVDEFANYTSLIGLVGTIIFLGLVIGVLVASFVFSGKDV